MSAPLAIGQYPIGTIFSDFMYLTSLSCVCRAERVKLHLVYNLQLTGLILAYESMSQRPRGPEELNVKVGNANALDEI